MSFPEPTIINIAVYSVPIVMIVSILFWSIQTYIKSEKRKRRKTRKKIMKEKIFRGNERLRMVDYIKSHKLGEYLKYGYSYCDFCGTKLFDGEAHDTQKCLINKYSHVVIK